MTELVAKIRFPGGGRGPNVIIGMHDDDGFHEIERFKASSGANAERMARQKFPGITVDRMFGHLTQKRSFA